MHSGDLYKVGIDTERYEFFTKNAYIFNKEKNTNLALILSTTLHNQDATYGRKLYNVDQTNVYASLMFETEFNPQNSFSAGLSFNYDAYDQHYRLENTTDNPLKAFEKEAVSQLSSPPPESLPPLSPYIGLALLACTFSITSFLTTPFFLSASLCAASYNPEISTIPTFRSNLLPQRHKPKCVTPFVIPALSILRERLSHFPHTSMP